MSKFRHATSPLSHAVGALAIAVSLQAPLTLALPASARAEEPTVRILLDLQHSILQAVPAANVAKLKASQIVHSGPKYYAVADDALPMLRRLSRDPRVKISIVSELSEAHTKALLEDIPLNASRGIKLASLVDKILPRGKADATLAAGCAETEACVFVSDDKGLAGLDPDQAANSAILSGPSYFHYDSFAQSQENAEALKKSSPEAYAKLSSGFPPNEATWKLHHHRAPGIFYALNQAISGLKSGKAGFATALEAAAKLPQDRMEALGATALARRPRWKSASGRVTGCLEQDVEGRTPATPLPMTICQNELSTHLAWVGTPKRACATVSEDEKTVIADETVATCLQKLPVHYFWVERSLDRCGAFTAEHVFVDAVPKEKCDLDVVCESSTGVLSRFTRDLANQLKFKVLKSLDEALPSSLRYKSSFASVLLDPARNRHIIATLGAECTNELTKIYTLKQSLNIQALYRDALPVLEVPYRTGVQDARFFHHTTNLAGLPALLHPEMADRQEALAASKADGGFDRVLGNIRTQPRGGDLWLSVLYIAEDPSSSADYGPHTVAFDFSSRAKVLRSDSRAWPTALAEIESRHPGLLAKCRSTLPPVEASAFKSGIYFMIAEDSGIDLIDYDPRVVGGALSGHHGWFQVLSTKNVVSTQVSPSRP